MWSRKLPKPCTRLYKTSRPHVLRNISIYRRLLDQGEVLHNKDDIQPGNIARPSTGIDASSARVSPYQTPRGQIVSTTDGSGDGTEAKASRKSQSDSKTYAAISASRYHDQGFHVNDSDSVSHADFTFSDGSQAKLGLVSAKLSVSAPGSSLQSLGTHDQKVDLLHKLDQACQESTLHGLGCLTQAIRTVGTVLPRTANSVLLLSANTAVTTPASNVIACIGATHQCAIEIGPWAIKATDKKMRFEDLLVSIRVQDQPNGSNQSSASSHTLGEDLRYLHETATMVVQRVTCALEFVSIHDMLDSVAQSLLRIVKPRTSSLEISMVTVKESQSGVFGCATWATSGEGLESNVDSLTRKIDFSVFKDNLHNSLAERLGDDESGVGRVVQETPLSTTGTAESASGLEPTQGESSFLKFSIGGRCFRAAAQTRFGADDFSLCFSWPTDSRMALKDLTKAGIVRRTLSAIAKASSSGVLGLRQVVESLRASVPNTPHVTLTLSNFKNFNYDDTNLGVKPLKVVYDNHVHAQAVILFPGLESATRRLHSTTTNGLTDFRIRIILRTIPNATAADEASLSQQCSRILRAINSVIKSVPGRSPSCSLYELASEYAAAVADSPTLLQDICDLYYVLVEASIHGPATTSEQTTVAVIRYRRTRPIIALGSNVGDRVKNIENAFQAIDADPDMTVRRTSALYETRPMYVEDQGTFVNGVCEIETRLRPQQLLNRLQSIERNLGRVKTINKGPRNIDLDIVMYEHRVFKTRRLTVPHQLMLEREFVLRPFNDFGSTIRHPITQRTVEQHLKELAAGEPSMFPLTPLAPGCEVVRSLDPVRRTHVMSVLNVTPDSFSDGGDNQPMHMDALRETIASHIRAGATIIDIGGQSSRPNAPDITAEEEIARILPAIETVKSMPEAKHISISVDTYRAAVAEAAIKAGAHIINDISAGRLDADMLSTVARLRCTYVVMHMRGTPATMQHPENTIYKDGLIATIASELSERIREAEEAGVPHWRIILDPGLGFAKTAEQNAELLGRFGELRNCRGLHTYPWLVGSSRKGFIGKFTGAEDPKDRVDGTAATVTAAVAGGAEIVRVHDVKEMTRVVKMADAMYRVRASQPAVADTGSVEEA